MVRRGAGDGIDHEGMTVTQTLYLRVRVCARVRWSWKLRAPRRSMYHATLSAWRMRVCGAHHWNMEKPSEELYVRVYVFGDF